MNSHYGTKFEGGTQGVWKSHVEKLDSNYSKFPCNPIFEPETLPYFPVTNQQEEKQIRGELVDNGRVLSLVRP
jgi:hypothetical protein